MSLNKVDVDQTVTGKNYFQKLSPWQMKLPHTEEKGTNKKSAYEYNKKYAPSKI